MLWFCWFLQTNPGTIGLEHIIWTWTGGTPKSSIYSSRIFHEINHQFWGIHTYGNPHITECHGISEMSSTITHQRYVHISESLYFKQISFEYHGYIASILIGYIYIYWEYWEYDRRWFDVNVPLFTSIWIQWK
jgi:hypothetical protein